MRDRHLGAACDDYLERTRRHLPIDVVEVEDDAALLRRLANVTGEIVAMEVNGEAWDTAKLTSFISDGMLHGQRTVTFLIGGRGGEGSSQAIAVGDDPAPSPGPRGAVRTALPRADHHQRRALHPLTRVQPTDRPRSAPQRSTARVRHGCVWPSILPVFLISDCTVHDSW